MLKKIWIALLALCLTLCAAACAEGIEFTLAGEGTEESPYLIASKEDLLQFAAVMNDDEAYIDYYCSNFQLTADIALNDCSGFDSWGENPPENAWTPIGYYHSFRGVFDGNGHKISGLYIDQDVCKDENGHVMDKFGLFGNLSGELKNLTVENAYIHPGYVKDLGSISTGALAGSAAGVISGCTVDGVILCEGFDCGGLVGSGGSITDCTFTGKMIEKADSHASCIGGIAGGGGNILNCSVSAQIVSENAGDQSVSNANIGGIAGIHQSFGNEKVIENCTFDGEIIGGNYAGGIVGHASASNFKDDLGKTIIRGCTNNGSITATVDAGGIVGFAMNTHSEAEIWVEDCVNRGQVKSLDTEICASAGILGHIDTRKEGPVIVTGCINEAEVRACMPSGIVGRIMQSCGNIRIEKCTNKGAIVGEGTYSAGILCHIQQWGDNWNIAIDQCVNEGDITTGANAGGILCFAFDADADASNRTLTITDCINRGALRSDGINNYMGGILGVNALAKAPVAITGCSNEGDLEYTAEVLVDAETLSGSLIMLSRTSGGIVGYVGTAPYLTLDSGERTLNNINVENACLTVENCSSTGRFTHKEAAFADDVDEAMIENWKNSGYDNVLNFFAALEGGIVGTIGDQENYSVNISGCSYENIEREIDDWNRFDTDKNI